MNASFSIYLDLVRFIAAFLVYLYHSNQRALVNDILPASNYGHSSVIVFFVLSGFVIAYVVDKKERDWRSYATSRISRIYSVAVPALLLTLVLDSIGRILRPDLYGYPYDQFFIRIASSLVMLNETWFVSITTFSNVPYWSICYESWYYVWFGVFMFAPKQWRWPILAILAIVLGPKILLLAPIWLTGAWIYHNQYLLTISLPTAIALTIISIIGIVFFHKLEINGEISNLIKSHIGEYEYREFAHSRYAFADYILTFFIALNFIGMRRLTESTATLWELIARPVRYIASFTFSLYLLHQPLFLFWAAVIDGDPSSYYLWLTITFAVMLSVFIVGSITENRRYTLRLWLRQHLVKPR